MVAARAIVTEVATPAGNDFLTRVLAPFGDDAVAAWAVVVRLKVLASDGVLSRPLAIWMSASFGALGIIYG